MITIFFRFVLSKKDCGILVMPLHDHVFFIKIFALSRKYNKASCFAGFSSHSIHTILHFIFLFGFGSDTTEMTKILHFIFLFGFGRDTTEMSSFQHKTSNTLKTQWHAPIA